MKQARLLGCGGLEDGGRQVDRGLHHDRLVRLRMRHRGRQLGQRTLLPNPRSSQRKGKKCMPRTVKVDGVKCTWRSGSKEVGLGRY